MARALIIKHPWIDLILAGKKTWELRSRRTKIRGKIYLIASGSGEILGTAELVDCIGPLSKSDLQEQSKHKVPADKLDRKVRVHFAWVVTNAKRFKSPVAYNHPSGAVIWVNLDRPGIAPGLK